MNSHRIPRVVAAAGLARRLGLRLGAGATEPPTPTPDPPRRRTIAVAPASVRLSALGATSS